MERIKPFMDTPFVKVLTGIRRCGKSTIMKMIRKELIDRGVEETNILFYRLDSLEYEDIRSANLFYNEIKDKLAKGKNYIFLDEIQEIDQWEKVVNTLMNEYDVDIYVTGSNSRMLSSEISTYLTGRYVSFEIQPLTFDEYLLFRKEYKQDLNPKEELQRFLIYGGFPAVQLQEYEREDAYTIVKDIYNSTIFTDIVKRNQIRRIDQLERIVKYVFDNVGQTFSVLSISKYIKSQGRNITPETIYNYLEKLEKAFIIRRCSRYDIKGKEYLKTQEKYYLTDISLRHAILGYSLQSIERVMENVVYIELISRGYSVNVGKVDQYEIDFVATRQEEKIYVQVSYKIEKEETFEREYSRLMKIKDNHPKYVVRMDDLAMGNIEGIHTIHLADFLLKETY